MKELENLGGSLIVIIVPLQRLKSLLTPDVNAFNAVDEREGISHKKLVIK